MKNNQWVKDLLATEAGKKKPAKKKADIPAHDKALFKGWQKEWYARQYGHMAEHLRPTPKGKTWRTYQDFMADAIKAWQKATGITVANMPKFDSMQEFTEFIKQFQP